VETTERERDYERAKRLQLEEENRRLRSAIPSTDKPKREDFEDDTEYLEALTDWKVESKLKAQRAEELKNAEEDSDRQTAEVVGQAIGEVSERGERSTITTTK